MYFATLKKIWLRFYGDTTQSLQLKSSKGFRAPGYFHRVPAIHDSAGKQPRACEQQIAQQNTEQSILYKTNRHPERLGKNHV